MLINLCIVRAFILVIIKQKHRINKYISMLQNCVEIRDSYLSAQIKISFLVELIRDWNVHPSAKLGC